MTLKVEIILAMFGWCYFFVAGEARIIGSISDDFLPTSDEVRAWRNYMQAFGKLYNSQEAEMKWLRNFALNSRIISHHNAADSSYSLGHNRYSDMDITEFLSKMTGFRNRSNTNRTTSDETLSPAAYRSKRQIPANIDWRESGYVTSVKDQVGAIEGQVHKVSGELTALSVQQVVDCYPASEGVGGCDEGYMEDVFAFANDHHGISPLVDYEYTAEVGACNVTQPVLNMSSVETVWIDDNEDAMRTAVASVGPVSVALDSSQPSFQLYSGGVYDDPACSTTNANHAMLLVGYGVQQSRDVWILKNSWGTSWGDAGYMYLARDGNNTCGIATYALYPSVTL